jgi:hypothetical protein
MHPTTHIVAHYIYGLIQCHLDRFFIIAFEELSLFTVEYLDRFSCFSVSYVGLIAPMCQTYFLDFP